MQHNKICKQCGETFHFCGSCDWASLSHMVLGYCSERCERISGRSVNCQGRKNDPENIGLMIDDVTFTDSGILVEWSSDVGFGQWWLGYDPSKELRIDTEMMDSNQDRAFSQAIMRRLVAKAIDVN